MITRRSLSSTLVAACLGGLATPALAQAYPTRGLRVVVPQPPGGGFSK